MYTKLVDPLIYVTDTMFLEGVSGPEAISYWSDDLR